MFYCALVFSVSALQFCPCAAGPTPRRQCMAHQYFNTTKCYTFFPRSIRLRWPFFMLVITGAQFLSLYVWFQGHLTWNEKRERTFQICTLTAISNIYFFSFAFHRYKFYTDCYNAIFISITYQMQQKILQKKEESFFYENM